MTAQEFSKQYEILREALHNNIMRAHGELARGVDGTIYFDKRNPGWDAYQEGVRKAYENHDKALLALHAARHLTQ